MSNKMKPALEILLERERERMLQRQEMEDMMQHSNLLRSISNVQTSKSTTRNTTTQKKQKNDKQHGDASPVSYTTISTDTTPSTINPAESSEDTPPLPKKTCNCKKSNCLKLYCECFQQGSLCGDECNCQGCHNNTDYESTRQRAIRVVLERNPVAFLPKVSKGSTVATTKYFRGCRCRRSGCLKKYCECYQAGVKCGTLCRCQMCKNCCSDGNHENHDDHEHEEHENGSKASNVASNDDNSIPMNDRLQPLKIKNHPSKRKLSQSLLHASPKYIMTAESFPVYTSRYPKSKPSSRLYPLETHLTTESAVQKICMSLVNAACLEVNEKPKQLYHKFPPAHSRPSFASPLKTTSSSSSSSPAQFNSPTVDALLCSEDVDMTPQKPYDFADRRGEIQEKAVLQEFSVWLRDIATASVNHLIKKST